MRCSHCPAPIEEHCRGEEVNRFCDFVNPSHPQYDPAYKRILVRDDHQGPIEMPPRTSESNEAASYLPCCGGNPYDAVGD